MKQKLPILLLLIMLVVGAVYFISKPSPLKPNDSSVKQIELTDNWQEAVVEEIGLTFRYPKELIFRKEIADDDGRIRTVGFFLTKVLKPILNIKCTACTNNLKKAHGRTWS